MGYSLPQIEDIIIKADKTLYKIGSIAYEDMFSENSESLDYERDRIFIYKKAVEWGDQYYVGYIQLDKIVERLASKLAIYDYGTLNPIYLDTIISDIITVSGYVPMTRKLTINGITQDLSADRIWTIDALPIQTGNAGKYLTTDGTAAYWNAISTTNIYTADGTLTGNRTVTMGSYTLSFEKDIYVYGLRVGRGSGNSNVNVAIGINTLNSNTSGLYNHAIGHSALYSNTTGWWNIAIGTNALYTNVTTSHNIGIGYYALLNNIGDRNTGVGSRALASNTTGGYNTALGFYAGIGTGGATANTTGTNNIFIGYQSVGVSATESNRTWIGNTSTTSTWLGGNLLLGSTTDTGLAKLQVTGAIQQTSVTSSLLKANASGVIVAAVSGTDYVPPSRTLTINGTTYDLSADRSWTVAGGVTSVGLSMPSAFTVTNSPVTSSGTLTVTGAGSASQYIDGTGALQTFPSFLSSDNLIKEVYNQTGATLTKGTVVYINGSHGNLPTITKAQANSDATSAQTLGLVQSDITNMNNGYIVIIGNILNLDTQAYADGTQLYLSGTTAGAYTSTKPYAPTHLVYIGIVVRSHPTQGIISVKVQNGYELDELHNVDAQSPSNSDGIFYNTATSLWEHKSIATVLGYTPANGNIYTTDGSLTANRTVTMSGRSLSLSDAYAVSTTATALKLINTSTTVTANQTYYSPSLQFASYGSDGTTASHLSEWRLFGRSSAAYPTIKPLLVLSSAIDGGSYVESFTFESTGKLTATSVVTGNLTMYTNGLSTGGALQLGSFYTTTTIDGASSGKFDVTNGTNTLFYIKGSTGNTIIGGTTDAGYKLDVQGTGRFTDNVTISYNKSMGPQPGAGTSGFITFGTTGILYNRWSVTTAGYQPFYISELYGTGVASAILQADSTTRGFLPPRMTDAQLTAIASPATGLQAYKTDATEGQYVNTSAGWKRFLTESDTSTLTRFSQTFTATAGQTLFTSSYTLTANYYDVYVNGVKVNDYSATTSTITLTDACSVNDIVDIVGFYGSTVSTGQAQSAAITMFNYYNFI